MSDRSVPSASTGPGSVWVGAGPDGAPEVLQVSVARARLFELVTQARPQADEPGVVTVVTKGRGRKEARAALVPLGCLAESSRSRLTEWPSWAQTAARPKLGDLVVAAAGDPEKGLPATPQVLLDRTTPAAVLVNAALLPDDGGPVMVPVAGWRHLTLSVREVARDWATLLDEMASGEVWVEVYRSRSSTSPRAALVPMIVLNEEHAGLLETWQVRDEAAMLGELDALVQEVTDKATAQDGAHIVVVAREGAPIAVLMDRGQAVRATVRPTGRPSAAPPTRVRTVSGRRQELTAGDAELPVALVAALDEIDATAAAGELDAVDPEPAGELPAEPVAGSSRRSVSALGDVLQEVLAPQGTDGPPTEAARFGLSALDEVVGGLLPGKLTLVAGAPGAGPSLLVAAVAQDTALRRRLPLLYAASGLTRTDVAMRVISAQAAVNYRALRAGQLTDEEQERAATVGAQLSGLAGSVWHIDDGAGLTASDITEVARDIEGLALVVVDRLQRAHDPAVPLSGRALPAAAQALTHVARLLKVPVVAAVDTDEAELLAALDADVTLTVRRHGEQAEVDYAERDFGILASAVLRADLACARFTDAPDSAKTRPLAKVSQAEPSMSSSAAAPQVVLTGDELERELLEAARPFTSGATMGIGARLCGALAALGQAASDGETGELENLRRSVAELAERRPTLPDTRDGHRLREALTAYAAARGAATGRAADPAHRSELPAASAPAQQGALARAGGLEQAEAELLASAEPLLGDGANAPLSLTARSVLMELSQALTSGDEPTLAMARERTAHLATRRLQIPGTVQGERLRTALATYGTAAATAGITPTVVPAAPASVTQREETNSGSADAEDVDAEDVSEAFQDSAVPPEDSGNVRRGRTYTFFTNKIAAAVDQALQEANGDIDEAIKLLKRKAVPDAMALFKLSRVGATYEHSVYPEPLEFLSKPSQKESDQIWEGRHKWRNAALRTAVKQGMLAPLDVTALDTNCAYLSAFKTYLPIGALRHHDRGFLPGESGIHRVGHFEWPHEDLPNPLGGRVEPGPYLLDEATVRLLIRCHELRLCEPPQILESWTSGGTEALLEKFRRILNEARTKAILEADKVTEEYVKAMYSRFTSTIGESGKNQELRRADWVHIIRSQAFASLWLKAHRAHRAGLTLVQVSGVDEIHLSGDWQQIWKEGRMPGEIKMKRLYTIGA